AVRASLRAWQGAIFNRRWIVAWGLVIGFGLTDYAVFVVVLACVLFTVFLAIVSRRVPVRVALTHSALLVALSAAPYALWYGFVRWKTGGFFIAEVSVGEVAWMVQSWEKGALVFASDLTKYAWELIALSAPQAAPVLALLMWALVYAGFYDRLGAVWAQTRLPVLAALLVSF